MIKSLEPLSCKNAVTRKPENKTILIRVLSPFNAGYFIKEFPSLLYKEDIIDILELNFSDANPHKTGYDNAEDYINYQLKGNLGFKILFNENMARKILNFVDEYINSVDTIWVHCVRGVYRSRAIILAINEIYKLGFDFQYYSYNTYVKDVLIKTFKKYEK